MTFAHVSSSFSSLGSLPMPLRGCDAGKVGKPNTRAHVGPKVDSNIGMEYGNPNQCCIPLINSKLMYAPIHANNVCRSFPFVFCLHRTCIPKSLLHSMPWFSKKCVDQLPADATACLEGSIHTYPIPRWRWRMLFPLPLPTEKVCLKCFCCCPVQQHSM